MRKLLMLAALGFLPLAACGVAGGPGGFVSFFLGPYDFALPVFNDGAAKSLVLRNLSDQDAPVRITIIPTFVTDDVVVPARGELRSPVSFVEGWVIVETRDPVTLAILATSGLVEPYLVTQRTGPDGETIYGAALHSQKALMPIFPRTNLVMLLNSGAVGDTFTVRRFGATDGSTNPQLGPDESLFVPANDYRFITLTDFASQSGIGHVLVLPSAPGFQFTLAAQQDPDLVYDVDDNLRGDARLLDQGGTAQAELILEYGRDGTTGATIDFHILASNPTDQASSFTINSIRDEFGAPIKLVPRTFNLGPRQTRLFATTVVDSLGLQVGEVHPFAEHFGDVFLATGMGMFHMNVSMGNNLIFRARQFDPVSFEFESAVLPTAIRRTTSVLMHDLQTTLASGTENWALLSNPTSSPINIQVRAYTRGEVGVSPGTEYLLPPIVIAPNSIYRFRGDALHLKETPNVPSLPDVPHLRFLFSSNSAFGTRGVRTQRDGTGLILLMSPHIVRQEE